MSHALPKQQTLLDCFLEAQAKRTKRRRRSPDAATGADPLQHSDDASALDDAESPPDGVKAARAV
ncbi:hypothetical protein S58_55680 [Bradyrhizobium oligotrophicum S58]|uniref:Uncharacterized protein n=1 Tax=Bradyrhizobium oligotrophicum S58 TaxID=1245469 RepID=M4ZYM0_9BRAD|nr:hypothetical protein S58_55680 [Bradyrhizobium oligotrophicum S58]